MEKTQIKNRKGQTLVLLIKTQYKQKGLSYIAHGLGGFKEQPNIEVMDRAFREAGYTTIRWDAADTIGESEGNMEDASITNYYEDLEDILDWSKSQVWYKEPFILSGHSLGGMISALYAEKYPSKVKAVAPISTVVSGKLSFESYTKKELDDWKSKGVSVQESNSKPGVIKKIKWSHMEDRLKYNLLENVDKLTMPVLLIVGENDNVTPLKHQEMLYKEIPSRQKELHIIRSAPHTFVDHKHLNEINKLFLSWIGKFN